MVRPRKPEVARPNRGPSRCGCEHARGAGLRGRRGGAVAVAPAHVLEPTSLVHRSSADPFIPFNRDTGEAAERPRDRLASASPLSQRHWRGDRIGGSRARAHLCLIEGNTSGQPWAVSAELRNNRSLTYAQTRCSLHSRSPRSHETPPSDADCGRILPPSTLPARAVCYTPHTAHPLTTEAGTCSR